MPVFMVRQDQYEAALARHPDVAQCIRRPWAATRRTEADRRTADAIISYRFPKDTLKTDAPNLKFLQVLGAGVDYLLPLDWVPKGVNVLTNSGAHVPKAAQSALMRLLMLNARMPELMTSHRANGTASSRHARRQDAADRRRRAIGAARRTPSPSA